MNTVNIISAGDVLQGFYFPAVGGEAIANVVFLQGFPGIEGDELICEALSKKGINVLTFNYRGVFSSEGNFTFTHAMEDINAAIAWLHLETGGEVVLGGWSFGSGLVPAGAALNPAIHRMFMISGRNLGEEARKIGVDADYADQVLQNFLGVRKPDGAVSFQDTMLDDMVENQANLDITEVLPRLNNREILLVGSWDDEISPPEEHLVPFYRLLQEQENRAVRIEVLQTDHFFTDYREELTDMIVGWLNNE